MNGIVTFLKIRSLCRTYLEKMECFSFRLWIYLLRDTSGQSYHSGASVTLCYLMFWAFPSPMFQWDLTIADFPLEFLWLRGRIRIDCASVWPWSWKEPSADGHHQFHTT